VCHPTIQLLLHRTFSQAYTHTRLSTMALYDKVVWISRKTREKEITRETWEIWSPFHSNSSFLIMNSCIHAFTETTIIITIDQALSTPIQNLIIKRKSFHCHLKTPQNKQKDETFNQPFFFLAFLISSSKIQKENFLFYFLSSWLTLSFTIRYKSNPKDNNDDYFLPQSTKTRTIT